jgi:cell division protein FtsN
VLLRGRPPAAPAAGGAAAGGPPLRSYTIDLKDSAATRSAPALAAPPDAAAGEAPAPSGAMGDVPAAPETATPLAATPAPLPEAAAAAATPAPAPEAAPAAATAASAATPERGEDAQDAAARYQVQLGLFASRANADRLAARASREGVRALVSGPDGRGLYRVHTPAYSSRAEAQAIQLKLRELGLSAALTPRR